MSKKNYTEFIHYSWLELETDIRILSEKISSSFSPDIVICISTGGWIPGRLMKNYINAKYYSIGCLAYDENGNFTGQYNITQGISDDLAINQNILILDEVCETGGTLLKVINYLTPLSPRTIYTAVIHKKKSSIYTPNYYLYQIEGKWIIYPWSKV
jgi:uncharacterized protein